MQSSNRSSAVAKVGTPKPDATMWGGAVNAPSAGHLDVVLKPLSRPDLGEIRIDGVEFAIGRTEQPFASYGEGILNMLSRQHARIFRKDGFVYLADLQSRNGTTVNRAAVGRAPCQLRDGDEICFGGELSYRVQITPRSRSEKSLTLTLTPRSDSGLDPIIITEFPFLISKTESTFAHYNNKSEHGRELSYLSRRHAYIYQKGGRVFIEDLGSGNGTFIDDIRPEHAVPLDDGAVVAFGGKHFAYRVSITRTAGEEPALNSDGKPGAKGQSGGPQPVEGGTQFMAAPSSFLEIFCAADEPKKDEIPTAQGGEAAAVVAPKEPPVKRRPRNRALLLLSELASLTAGGEPGNARRVWLGVGAVTAVLVALVLTAYFWNAAERDLKNAVAQGDYIRAATLASRLMQKHPDDAELKARATEAALKGFVPAWLVKVRARDFNAAQGVLAGMSEISTRDTELRPMIDELVWLASLERLVTGRGGPEAPIRIYADEDTIEHVIVRWNEDTGEHQRALARIASYVPQFGDWYGEPLTHLRKLQSESTVYLPVIERVKANIATELGRDNPDALQSMLKETAQKYPGLGGMDGVRQDLSRYIEIRREARKRKSGRLFALLHDARFQTPPFEQSVHASTESGQLPSAALLQQYDTATQAWKDGNTADAIAGLQKIAEGPWGEDAALELQRRQDVASRFAAMQETHNADGYVDRLLAFRGSLDPDEDVYFLRATSGDLNQQKDKVIARAQEAMNQARSLWQQYQSDGAIDASERIEISISDQFRARAHLLAEASKYAQQGFMIYSQVDPAGAAQWAAIRDDIQTEADEQRDRLRDLSNVVEPELLKIKLALLGDTNE